MYNWYHIQTYIHIYTWHPYTYTHTYVYIHLHACTHVYTHIPIYQVIAARWSLFKHPTFASAHCHVEGKDTLEVILSH